MNLQEIKSAIKQLEQNEIGQLASWLQEYLDEMWDRQIEIDLETGKLDNLIAKAEADIAANRVKDINEILREQIYENFQKTQVKEQKGELKFSSRIYELKQLIEE
jgi:flagellar biosynthesis GTPase FlhF